MVVNTRDTKEAPDTKIRTDIRVVANRNHSNTTLLMAADTVLERLPVTSQTDTGLQEVGEEFTIE